MTKKFFHLLISTSCSIFINFDFSPAMKRAGPS